MSLTYTEALEIATKYHKGQVRKFSGLPYITHPIAVAEYFLIKKYKIVAVLHDTIEDTTLTLEELSKMGASEKTLTAIDLLTHKEKQSYFEYIMSVKENPTTRLVKMADIEHNMSDLKNGCQKDKYELALYILEA